MNIDQLKLQLVQHILSTDDVELLTRVRQMLTEKPYKFPEDEAAQLNDPPSWYKKTYGSGPVATDEHIALAEESLRHMQETGIRFTWDEVQQAAKEDLHGH